jgi:hypothetical protein
VIGELNNAEDYLKMKRKATPQNFFKQFARYLMYRNIANFDSMALISGGKGTGKSSFAMMMAIEWCRLIGIKFDFKKHIVYTNQQFQDRIDNLPRFHPIIADEAVNFAMTENWNKVENKELKKKLAQIRTKHLFFILCFPLKVTKVDKVYLDSFVNYWIAMFGRGRGALFVKDENPVHDAWRLKEFQDMGAYTEFSSLERIQKMLEKHPNFWSVITNPKPPELLYRKYITVRDANVYHDAQTMLNISAEDLQRAVLILVLKDIMVRDSSISMRRLLMHIGSEYGVTVSEAALNAIIEDSTQLIAKAKLLGTRK